MSNTNSDTDMVRTAGRGVIYITFAKLWFMVVGYAIVFSLPRIFRMTSGSELEGQALWGAYRLVVMAVSFVNNGIITGTIQAVSKFTSEDESNAGAVKRTGLKVQGGLGVILAIAYIGLADIFAEILGSPDLVNLMRISAFIIVAYSCYAVFIGSFNGRRLFGRQALFDIGYNTLKVGLIIGLAAAGLKVFGTVVGFLIAAVVVAVAAGIASRTRGSGAFPIKTYAGFAAKLIIYTFILNLVMGIDLFLLKAVSTDLAVASGQDAASASTTSKALAGQYGSTQVLALISYQAIISIAFVAFPMISKATASNDALKTRHYIRNTLRFSTIFIVGIAAVFAALPSQSLDFAFGADYRQGGEALGILSIGIAAFGLMVVSNTILNGAGLPWRAMSVIIFTLAAVVGCVMGFLKFSDPGIPTLAATAKGSAVGMGAGLLLSGIMVYRRFGAFWPAMSAVRVAIAGGASIGVGRFLLPDAGKLLTLVECAGVFLLYFVILAMVREFNKEDLAQLGQVLRRTKK